MSLEYISSVGGIAGVLAVLMFGLMKWLIKQARDDRKFTEDRMANLLKDYNDVCMSYKDALVDNTRVTSELYTYLKMRNGDKRG